MGGLMGHDVFASTTTYDQHQLNIDSEERNKTTSTWTQAVNTIKELNMQAATKK